MVERRKVARGRKKRDTPEEPSDAEIQYVKRVLEKSTLTGEKAIRKHVSKQLDAKTIIKRKVSEGGGTSRWKEQSKAREHARRTVEGKIQQQALSEVGEAAAEPAPGEVVRTYRTSLVPILKRKRRKRGDKERRQSVTERQVLGAELRALCREVNTTCEAQANAMMTFYRQAPVINAGTRRDFQILRRLGSNLEDCAIYTLGNTVKQALTTDQKVRDFARLLRDPRFATALPNYLLTGFVNRHLATYLARTWGVRLRWVRDLTRGWRRRLDPHLPVGFQAEPAPGFQVAVAASYTSTLGRLTPDEQKALWIIQKHHTLHLLSEPLCIALLPATLHKALRSLQRRVGVSSLPTHSYLQLTPDEFQQAARSTHNQAIKLHADLLSDAQQAQKSGDLTLERRKRAAAARVQTFGRLCALLGDPARFPVTHLRTVLSRILSTSRFVNAVAKMVAEVLATPGTKRRRRTLAAVSAILSAACASKYPGAPASLLATLMPSRIVTVPFHASTREKDTVPLELMVKPIYVILRPGNNAVLTRLLKTDGYFDVEVPIHALTPAGHLVKGTSRTTGIQYFKKRKSLQRCRIPSTPKMRDVLARDAQVALLRLFPPTGPSHQVKVDIIFRGPPDAFGHRTVHLKGVKPVGKKKLRGVPLGVDVNRIGPHVLTFNTAKNTPTNPLNAVAQLQEVLETSKRIKKVTTEIARQSVAKSHLERKGASQQAGKVGRNIYLCHRRKGKLKAVLDLQCSLSIAKVLVQTGATEFRAEELDVTLRNKKGALARAITNMPKKLEILTRGVAMANAFYEQKGSPKRVRLGLVDPRGTSTTCATCGKKLIRSPTNWDVAYCPHCKRKLNAHENAAINIAKRTPLRYITI